MGIWIRSKTYSGPDVCVDVEFTTGRKVGEPPEDELDTRTWCRAITSVVTYTEEQVKTWIRSQVENERLLILQGDINALLDLLIDVDIEETP